MPRAFRLRAVTKIFYENCFQAGLDQSHAPYPSIFPNTFPSWGVTVSRVEPALERRLPNSVMVYGPSKVAILFENLVKKFSSI